MDTKINATYIPETLSLEAETTVRGDIKIHKDFILAQFSLLPTMQQTNQKTKQLIH